MVAVIKTGHSIHRILNYNENKIKEGVAECIGAGNYPVDVDKMSFTMKLNRFLKQMALNENVKRNSVHISVNFDPSENHFSKEKLKLIANTYMEKLGFGNQPYLIYQHHDAGHPHIHLVTINIGANGKRIDLHHLGIRKSEPARKSIEKEYGLVKAELQKKQEQFQLKPVSTQKVFYGKSQTKKAIQNVLDHVISQYKFTSLPELNAVLRQYNVLAERGSENSRIYKHKGLIYRVQDAAGNSTGVPIKASDFYNKPTLSRLEEKYQANDAERRVHKTRLKNAIDMALVGKTPIPIQNIVQTLDKQGIHMMLRESDTGLIYGITYVDHRTRCVFNGSALGKQYSARAIQERCGQYKALIPSNKIKLFAKAPLASTCYRQKAADKPNYDKGLFAQELPGIDIAAAKVLDVLLQPDHFYDDVPYQLKRKSKRKKSKPILKHL